MTNQAPPIEVPSDEESERDCAAIAATGRGNASALLERVAPSDFYFPRYRRIVECVLDDAVVQAASLDARLIALSAAADIGVDFLREMTETVLFGRRFLAPRLVAVAARRRRLMDLSASLYNGGSALTVDELSEIIDGLVALRDEIAGLDRPHLVLVSGGAA